MIDIKNTLYIVCMEGICIREIKYITYSPSKAKEITDELAKNDVDDYHDWVIYKVIGGTIIEDLLDNRLYETKKGK